MKFFRSKDNQTKEPLEPLLWELREMIQSPPTPFDLQGWRQDLEEMLKRILRSSKSAHDQLEDLVMELEKRGIEHVRRIDDDNAPAVIEQSARSYFEQVGFLTSEIQSIRPT